MTTIQTDAPNKPPLPPRANGHADTPPQPPSPLPADVSRRSSDLSAEARSAKGEASAKEDAMRADIATLPDDVLAVLVLEVPREQQRRLARKQADFFALCRAQATILRVTPAQVAAAFAGKTAAKARAKAPANGDTTDGRSVVNDIYWNPKDHSQRTNGRGPKKPQWFLDHLAAGGTKADMRIPKDPA